MKQKCAYGVFFPNYAVPCRKQDRFEIILGFWLLSVFKYNVFINIVSEDFILCTACVSVCVCSGSVQATSSSAKLNTFIVKQQPGKNVALRNLVRRRQVDYSPWRCDGCAGARSQGSLY